MPEITCRTRTIRVEPRTLNIGVVDHKVITRFADIADENPVGGKVHWTREKAAWSAQDLYVRKLVGTAIEDFDTPLVIQDPTTTGASSGSVELPADELADCDGVVVGQDALESGAVASIEVRLRYAIAEGGGVVGDAIRDQPSAIS